MANIKIMTDSSVQLTEAEITKYHITVIPLSITIDGTSYIDGVDITRTDFVSKMNAAQDLPKTSQPPIGKFVDAFNQLTADGSEVLGIFMAKALSGTVDAARQAASLAKNPERIQIVDSQLTDRALGFQVLAAARDVTATKPLAIILQHLKQMQANQHLDMMVITLKNLIKGGRLGPLTGTIATLLNIRISLRMPGGRLEVGKKGRGKRFTEAFNSRVLAEIAANVGHIKEVGISYVDTPEPAHALADRIKQLDPKIDILVAETSPIIATHSGHGAYAILYYTE